MPAFTDSVDSGGGHATGICGEKQVTLDTPKPTYLSLTMDGVDPTLNPFTIDFDDSSATEADIATHTISYTVSFVEYVGIASDFSG